MNRIKHTPEYYKDLIFSLTNLPTIPIIATEILRMAREDRLSINQMLPIIMKDPPLAMKILRIANSAYYGISNKTESLRQAIVIIGMKELTHLILSFSVIKLLTSQLSTMHWVEWKKLWEHSAACGHVAQLLGKKVKINIPGSPYSFGLLHDVGKLVLFRIDPENFLAAANLVQEERITGLEAEKETFGVTHCDVGKWLAEKWDLPAALIQVIGHHHNPEECTDPKYIDTVSLIQVSDLVCNLKSINFETDFIQSIPREEIGWQLLQAKYSDLKELDFERFILSMDEEVETIKSMVELTQL